MQQFTNKQGSLASLLIQALADRLVMGCPSDTVILRVFVSFPVAMSKVKLYTEPLSSPAQRIRPLASNVKAWTFPVTLLLPP